MTKRSRNGGECPICYVDLDENLEECVHCKTAFHKDCVREWHKYQPELKAGPITCPQCRKVWGDSEARQDAERRRAAMRAGRRRPGLHRRPGIDSGDFRPIQLPYGYFVQNQGLLPPPYQMPPPNQSFGVATGMHSGPPNRFTQPAPSTNAYGQESVHTGGASLTGRPFSNGVGVGVHARMAGARISGHGQSQAFPQAVPVMPFPRRGLVPMQQSPYQNFDLSNPLPTVAPLDPMVTGDTFLQPNRFALSSSPMQRRETAMNGIYQHPVAFQASLNNPQRFERNMASSLGFLNASQAPPGVGFGPRFPRTPAGPRPLGFGEVPQYFLQQPPPPYTYPPPQPGPSGDTSGYNPSNFP